MNLEKNIGICDRIVFSSELEDFFKDIELSFCQGSSLLEIVYRDIWHFNKPLRYLNTQGQIIAFAFPPVFFPDCYLHISEENTLYVYLNLFDLSNDLEIKKIDSHCVKHILTKGYSLEDESLLEGVVRASGFTLYKLEGSMLTSTRLPFKSTQESFQSCASYEDFKRMVNYSVDSILESEKNRSHYVLLSGGADSRLLLLLLKYKGIDIEARVCLNKPLTMYDNAKDTAIAKNICKSLDVPIRVVFSYENKNRISDLKKMSHLIPCCPHQSLSFMSALEDIDENSVVWTGQNMDALYNLGPTHRTTLSPHGIAGYFKRFFLSEMYWGQLEGIESSSKISNRLLSKVGLLLFRLYFSNEKLSLPTNANDYLKRFGASDDYLVLRETEKRSDRHVNTEGSQCFTFSEIKKQLLALKVSYLRGGDALCISAAASMSNSKVAFPYSSPAMLSWFAGYPLTSKDVKQPKRFVYRYIMELAGLLGCEEVGRFDHEPSKKDLRNEFGDLVEHYSYMNSFVESSLGQAMRSEITSERLDKKMSPLSNYNMLYRAWWVDQFKHYLESL